MSIVLNNAARAAIKKALRGKVAGLDTMTKAELLAAAESNGIDVAALVRDTAATVTEVEAEVIPAPVKTDTAIAPALDAIDKADAARKLAEIIAALSGGAAMNEARVVELIQQHAPKGDTREVVILREVKAEPQPERALPDVPRHEMFAELLAAVSSKVHVMLVGPAGCSKTHIASQIAEALGIPFFFNGALDSEYKLRGFVDAQGRIVSTAFRKAYQNGGLYLFDEIDASLAGALLALNAALANGHYDFPDEMVPMHPDFRCMAAANTFGRGADRVYVGRNQLDAASLDRFTMWSMDYDEKLERVLFGDTEWTAFCHKARAAVRSLNIRHVVSMRAIMQGHALIKAGISRDKVEAAALWKGLDPASVEKVKAAM